MTQAADSTASATLSGRELALKRRQAMSLHGKAGVAKTAATKPAAAPRIDAGNVAPAVAEATPRASVSDAALIEQLKAVSPKKAGRSRREALSQSGKAALQTASARPTGRVRPSRQADLAPAMSSQPAMAEVAQAAASSCGCGCNGQPGGCGDAQVKEAAAVVQAPASLPTASSVPTGRALARARRAALAQDGKAGLKRVAQATKIAASMPGQDWQAAITKGATGRQVAMQRRLVQSVAGKTGASADSARPSGRMRARNVEPAPAKVEEGHTLSGGAVTGTMVERSKKVTGNEPGSCRAITGTEYIGSEQFDNLCKSRPEAGPAKVGVTNTLREHKVTGTEVGRSTRVTGDEVGACRGITGTEYLSVERYDEFCASRPAPAPAKIGISNTAKGKSVSGTQVSNGGRVTGGESGSDRAITGTSYAKQGADASPDKVAVTHTGHGNAVTGTAVGHTAKITGDETGACRGITGTEYLATEQFQAECNTAPLATPRKVSVMSSSGSQSISGSEVGRSAKVTGDEPGSCRQITGSQYYNSGDFGALCNASGPRKVGAMQTLAGRTVTGTEVNRGPKMTGDEEGGCIPVTGTDYVGADELQAVCAVSTPVAPVAKVAVDQTWRGQAITGSYVGRSAKVTGAEPGGCAPISGTPYIGRGQYNGFCEAPAVDAQAARIRTGATIPATAVTGDRPGAGGSVMTGDERGACEVVSGTPYVGPDNAVTQCLTSGRFVSRARTFEEPER
ncbi:MAG: carboxysome shell protein, partial [Burkholderiales bacterium]